MSAPIDKKQFDLVDDHLWVMHCAEGPVPRRAASDVRTFLAKETQPWTLRWDEDFCGLPRAVREEAANILGVDAADVTLTATTSAGLIQVAQGTEWHPGDEVVLALGEFPANIWPWKALEHRGVTVREQPLWDGHLAGADAWRTLPPPGDVDPESALIDAIGSRTRLLAVSWVRFQDGLKLDLTRLAQGCRKRGVRLVVDGIQGAGTQRADLGHVAAFASGGHKGLLAPQGLGILWTDPDFRSTLMPVGSWLSVEQATDFDRPSTDVERGWAQDGTSMEQGVPNLIGCVAMLASLRLISRAGVAAIERHIDELQGELLEGLAESPQWKSEAARLETLRRSGRLGSIVALHHGRLGKQGLDRILERGLSRRLYASVREGYLRIALHGWHESSDIGRLLDWLRE